MRLRKYFRVTKYNPKYRDTKGSYIGNDFSSISDISNDLESIEYYKIEDKYVWFVSLLFNKFNYKNFEAIGINIAFKWSEFSIYQKKGLLYEGKSIYDGLENNTRQIFGLNNLKVFIRMSLREMLGSIIICDKLEINIYSDLYLFITTSDIYIYEYIKSINIDGLFVEYGEKFNLELDHDYKKHVGYTDDHLK